MNNSPQVGYTNAINNILSRTSSPKISTEPPSEDELDIILQAGMTANDHGRLKPWRFQVYKGSARERLSQAFLAHEKVEGNEMRFEKAQSSPFRAPVVVCVIASPKECKIPLRDQLFSAASACQLITLMAHCLNVSSIWRTGLYAESKTVNSALGLAPREEIVGFIYLGKSLEEKSLQASQTIKGKMDELVKIYE